MKKTLAWAFYDWANSAFATTVMAGFFPVFFKQYWSVGTDVNLSTFKLGAANSLAGVLVAVMAPVLGAIADRGGARRKFLFFFAAMGVVMTGALYLVAEGRWALAVGVYVTAIVGFSGANVFYDSLLVVVAPEPRRDFVSALGFSLGYLGGGVLFALNVFMTLKPQLFGLADVTQAVRWSFLSVAVWWAVFSIPLLVWVKDTETPDRARGWSAVTGGFRQLSATFHEIRKFRMAALFLLSYWLYIDGVDTIIRMAVDFGLSLGFQSSSLMLALLITQFVGFPAAIGFGKIGEKLGPKTGIFIGLAVYLGVTLWGYFMTTETEFYVLAAVIGLVQGGVQALSRSFYARLVPARRAAEFFGFYNMLGKFAAVIGPFLMGWVGLLTGSSRLSILSIAALFILGGLLLHRVDEEEGRRAAREFEEAFNAER